MNRYPSAADRAVWERRSAISGDAGVTKVVLFDASLFPKGSKPSRGLCSGPGCIETPVMARISTSSSCAYCETHGRSAWMWDAFVEAYPDWASRKETLPTARTMAIRFWGSECTKCGTATRGSMCCDECRTKNNTKPLWIEG